MKCLTLGCPNAAKWRFIRRDGRLCSVSIRCDACRCCPNEFYVALKPPAAEFQDAVRSDGGDIADALVTWKLTKEIKV